MIPFQSGSDFSAVVGFHQWVFGVVAYRSWTEVLLGDESRWFALPSWLTAVLFFTLAAAEWLLLRLLTSFLARWSGKHWRAKS